MTKLTDADFTNAAKLLDVPESYVRAVCEVESAGDGMDSKGRPKILFEGHIFSRLTNGQYDPTHPSISYPGWTGRFYTTGKTADARNEGEHKRLDEAAALNRNAALQSASWGLFQIMGSNFRRCGFETVQGFVNAMYDGEAGQMLAFIGFIKTDAKLWNAMKAGDWATFARIYNGPGYAKNKYDTKLALAVKKHA